MAKKVNFSLTQLEYVLAVHKLGHFSHAAKACHVTQPTLSMQIQKLEEELGTVIFDRTKKPVALTEKGTKLVEQMRAILYEARKVDAILHSDSEAEVKGSLDIGIIPTVAPYLLPRLLPVVAKLYPGLQLKILELQTQRIVQALEEDQIDLGILATPLGLPKIHERSLYWEKFSLMAQKGHVLTKGHKVKYSDLEFDDLWLLEEGHCLRNQMVDICAHRPKKNSKRQFLFESGSLETLKSLVKSYGGYTLLPALATEGLPAGVTLMPFESPIPAREIGIVTSRLDYKKPLQDALAHAILECIPEAVRKIKRKDLELMPVG
ncbi:MAG: LysR substrate-binding domain-containing protein [Bdellovibrionota bacterium]